METPQGVERVEIGADVQVPNGDKVGTVSYVVVRPAEMHVMDIVVSTGAILGRDVVVPMDSVTGVKDGVVHLAIDASQLETCSDFVDVHYRQPPQEWVPPPAFAYPTGGAIWPADMYYPQPDSVEVNAPAGTVSLYAGMDVESSDGHKIGSIAALDTDPSTENVTGFVIKEGVFFKHEVAIPVDAITDIHESRVVLKGTKDELQKRLEEANP